MIVKTDPDTLKPYLFDASNLHGKSEKVLIPESLEELVAAVSDVNDNGGTLTISGAGTGLTGGRVANGGAIISLEKFRDMDMYGNILECGVGVSWRDANSYAESYGYFIGPNPTEYNSSIGGNINTNASGARTYKYGTLRDKIRWIEIVLSDGTKWKIERGQYLEKNKEIELPSNYRGNGRLSINYVEWPDTKNATGYKMVEGADLIDLFIGSEGTLGIVTSCGIECEKLPDQLIGGIVFFEVQPKLIDFVEAIQNHTRLTPRLLEYFDENALRWMREKYQEIPDNASGAIWFEEEINEGKDIEETITAWYEEIIRYSKLTDETWFAQNDKEHRRLSEFRHHLPEMIYENISERGQSKIGTDSAVPKNRFREYFEYLNSRLRASGIKHVVFGHIGNSHVHANLFPDTREQSEIGKRLYQELMKKAVDMGGTVSAEHGIGKLKRDYFYMMYGDEAVAKMKKVKDFFDPNGIFNPGNLFL